MNDEILTLFAFQAATKVIRNDRLVPQHYVLRGDSSVLAEAFAMLSTKSPFVVRLIDYHANDEFQVLVMEYHGSDWGGRGIDLGACISKSSSASLTSGNHPY